MNRSEIKKFALMLAVFLGLFFLPVGSDRFRNAIYESLHLLRWYAREHVLLCLIPALFIAGAIAVFVRQAAVMKYLGAGANKVLAYGVAGVSGSILAVCSCTVLPLFAGIYRMGAGLGPAVAFLYAGPAINVLAIILTARILGWQLGVARAVGAIVFSIVIGLIMHLLYRREEQAKAAAAQALPEEPPSRSLGQQTAYFATMVGILVFANLADFDKASFYHHIHQFRWVIVAAGAALLIWMLRVWFHRDELKDWLGSTWGFAKLILPLLLIGVLLAGFLLGSGPGRQGIIPNAWVETALGGNGLRANLFAAVAGAFMYFATLTEVPIVQGLIGSGMGKGPALALLLAGPALTLPNMLVIRSIMGARKTIVFVALVVIMATASGLIFGAIYD